MSCPIEDALLDEALAISVHVAHLSEEEALDLAVLLAQQGFREIDLLGDSQSTQSSQSSQSPLSSQI